MTGTTQVALLVAGIGVAGAVGGVLLNAHLQRRNARRAAHESAVAAARVIKREIEAAVGAAETALEHGAASVSVRTSAWEQNQTAVATRLAEEEHLVVERFYAVAATGEAALIVMVGNQLAIPAITWLAEGNKNVLSKRKIDTVLSPRNIELPCECGHAFNAHNMCTVRRWIRVRRRDARFKDKRLDCLECDCKKFRGVGDLDYYG
jgi:hypothetical protein